MNPKTVVTLDRPRELTFDGNSLIELERLGINLLSPETYNLTSPLWMRSVLWAGQLRTPKPLTLEQVGKYLPVNLDKYTALAKQLAAGLRADLGLPKKIKKREPKPNTPSPTETPG